MEKTETQIQIESYEANRKMLKRRSKTIKTGIIVFASILVFMIIFGVKNSEWSDVDGNIDDSGTDTSDDGFDVGDIISSISYLAPIIVLGWVWFADSIRDSRRRRRRL